MTKTKALVTGGAGFIGSHLCQKLLKIGFKVLAFDNLYSGSMDNLKEIQANSDFKFIKGDVRNKPIVNKLVQKADIIFHLAAILGVSKIVDDPLNTVSVNIEGVKIICESAYKYGKKKVLFTSSSEVYGKNESSPLKENSNLLYGPTTIARWNYGLGKAMGEHILWSYSKKGLPIAIVRLFNSYGPRGVNNTYSHVIPKFIVRALKGENLPVFKNGRQTRTFCYVDDTVNGIINASAKLKNEVVNIGSSHETNITSLAKKIIRITKSGSVIEYLSEEKVYGKNFESVNRRVPDISKAKKIGFLPKISLEKGLKMTINQIMQEM